MEVALSASTPALRNSSKLRRLRKTAGTMAPATPTAADSVGVAIPKKMEPRIITINKLGKASDLRATSFSRNEARGCDVSSGTHSGFSQLTTTM